jgi:ribosomal protein L11 methyltransferase
VIRLAVRAPLEATEQVLAALLELAPAGVEQVDGDGFVELALYGAPGEVPELEPGQAEVGGVRVHVSASAVPDDWEERWRTFHRPVLVGERVYVRPPWEPAREASWGRPTEIDVVIDPGRAFGTGAHATTRLCVELLLEVAARDGGEPRGSLCELPRSVCDLGCGSGVLSIAAARLGFGPITALDADPLAIEATTANAAANGVELESIERANLSERAPPAADLVLANLMRPLLLRVAALMPGRPSALIASGLLEGEADEVVAAFAPLVESRRVADQGWCAVLLVEAGISLS